MASSREHQEQQIRHQAPSRVRVYVHPKLHASCIASSNRLEQTKAWFPVVVDVLMEKMMLMLMMMVTPSSWQQQGDDAR
jgi:hypothetical protein